MRLAVLRLEDRLTPVAYTWTGGPGGQGTDWTSPANWSPTGVPSAGDTASITGTSPSLTGVGGVLVSINSTRLLNVATPLSLTGPASSFPAFNTSIISAAGTLTLGPASTNQGTIAGTGLDLTFGNGSTNAGTLGTGGGPITFHPGSSNTASLMPSGPLTFASGTSNSATITLNGTTLTANGLTNSAGGILEFNGAARLDGSQLVNAGTATFAGTSSVGGTAIANAGTLTVSTSAAFNLAGGLSNSGTTNFNTVSRTIEGGLGLSAGTINVANALTLTLGGSSTYSGGTLNAPLLVIAGSFAGTATLVRPVASTTTVSGVVSAPLANAGTITNGTFNGPFTNTGTFQVVGGAGLIATRIGGPFTNSGTMAFTSSDNSPSVLTMTAGGSFTNGPSGSVRVLPAAPRGEITGGTFTNQGITSLEGGADLWIDSAMTNAGTLTFFSSQLFFPNGGTYTQTAGTTDLGPGNASGIANATVAIQGGTLTGNGVVSDLSASSAATVTPAGTNLGFLTVLGSATLTGSLAVNLFGTTNGVGVPQYDQVLVNDSVTVGGTLTVVPNYTPAGGDLYRIIENYGGSPVSGTFAGLPEGATFTVSGRTFRISYVGGTGNDVTLTAVTPTAAPRVSGVAVNFGQANTTQRSRVTSLRVTFSTPVTFAGPVANAFIVSRLNGGQVGGFTATASDASGATVVTLDGFTGAETQFGSLADGRYVVTVLANQVSGNGQPLDGNGNGVGGDDYTLTGTIANRLFRLFGDANGDGTVSGGDFGVFRLAFGTTTGDPGYVDWLDFDGNGSISGGDFGNFRVRFGTTVP